MTTEILTCALGRAENNVLPAEDLIGGCFNDQILHSSIVNGRGDTKLFVLPRDNSRLVSINYEKVFDDDWEVSVVLSVTLDLGQEYNSTVTCVIAEGLDITEKIRKFWDLAVSKLKLDPNDIPNSELNSRAAVILTEFLDGSI